MENEPIWMKEFRKDMEFMEVRIMDDLASMDRQMFVTNSNIEAHVLKLAKNYDFLGKVLREQYFGLGKKLNNLLELNKSDNEGKLSNDTMDAKELLKAIDNMDNKERIDLLSLMYDKYYNINKNLGVKEEDYRLEAANLINRVLQVEKELEEIKIKFIAE